MCVYVVHTVCTTHTMCRSSLERKYHMCTMYINLDTIHTMCGTHMYLSDRFFISKNFQMYK